MNLVTKMANTILPEVIRDAIKELFGEGYTRDAVLKFFKAVAQKYVEYRIFYDDQMDLLFYGSKMPLAPIEAWIRDQNPG